MSVTARKPNVMLLSACTILVLLVAACGGSSSTAGLASS
jgi:hypothetical protein